MNRPKDSGRTKMGTSILALRKSLGDAIGRLLVPNAQSKNRRHSMSRVAQPSRLRVAAASRCQRGKPGGTPGELAGETHCATAASVVHGDAARFWNRGG